MRTADPKYFHQFYGKKDRRMVYKKSDFLDYVIMSILCSVVLYFTFGGDHVITLIGYVCSVFMIIAFPVRHGYSFAVPVIFKKPQEIVLSLFYKFQNLSILYPIALGVLLLENYIIYLTPEWPHKVELMTDIAFGLFYLHLAGLTLYRTYILYVHLKRKELVKEILMQTMWRKQITDQPNISFEIVHAYVTGLSTHLLLLVPWYLVITYAKFSLVLMPVILVINFFTQARFLKVINTWFYRDHWLAHHSAFEFVYLHGPHHDAIPSGLIGVAGNGQLEGLMRHAIGAPAPFYHPLTAVMVYTFEVQGDIEAHQYIPGMYPKANMAYQKLTQHSMHHMGQLEPFGFGLNIDQPDADPAFKTKFKILPDEIKNSIKLDEELTGYRWDNSRFKKHLELIAKYED